MNRGAIEDRTRSAGASEPAIVNITPSVIIGLVQAQRTTAPVPAKDPLAAIADSYQYRVAPYDVLSVIVWDHPELTIPAGEYRSAESTGNPVSAAGNIFYPHIGTVRVAGLTVDEIRTLLAQRLAEFVESPQLDVRVVSFRGKRIQVTGEVKEPGPVPITDVPLRVQDVIAAAKGLTPDADPQRVTLSRAGTTYLLDLQAMYERGEVGQNWLVQDGDVVNVPDRTRNKVYVLGEVRRPSSRLMVKGRMNLAEAIGDAEGFNPTTSNPGEVYVFRGRYEAPLVYRLDSSSPDALLLASRFELAPQDIVYVAATRLSTWNRVVTQILPTVQAIWYASDATVRAKAAGTVIIPP